jgi:hypothetical protein
MDLKVLHTKRRPLLVSPAAKTVKPSRQPHTRLCNSPFLSVISKQERSRVPFYLDLAQRLELTTLNIFKGAIKPEQICRHLSSN